MLLPGASPGALAPTFPRYVLGFPLVISLARPVPIGTAGAGVSEPVLLPNAHCRTVISQATVRKHVDNVLDKLSAVSRMQTIARAREASLL